VPVPSAHAVEPEIGSPSMSTADERESVPTVTLDDADRSWLEASLVEYRDLLIYLQEH
jgi:hypothetical protein